MCNQGIYSWNIHQQTPEIILLFVKLFFFFVVRFNEEDICQISIVASVNYILRISFRYFIKTKERDFKSVYKLWKGMAED